MVWGRQRGGSWRQWLRGVVEGSEAQGSEAEDGSIANFRAAWPPYAQLCSAVVRPRGGFAHNHISNYTVVEVSFWRNAPGGLAPAGSNVYIYIYIYIYIYLSIWEWGSVEGVASGESLNNTCGACGTLQLGMGDNRLRKIADLVVLVFDQLKLRFFVTIRLETLLIDCPHRRASKRKKKKTNNKLYIYIYIYIYIHTYWI